MSYQIKFSEKGEKQFNKLENSIVKRFLNVFERIKQRPFHFIKKKEGTPYFLLRVGNHRAVLDIDLKEKIIYVIEAGHRKDIYK